MVDMIKSLALALVAAVVVLATVFASLAVDIVFFAVVLVFVDFLTGTAFFLWGAAAALSIIWMVIR